MEQHDVVFLVDGSGSIDSADWNLQRQGLAAALQDRVNFPVDGSVAVSVIQWAAEAPRPRHPTPSGTATPSAGPDAGSGATTSPNLGALPVTGAEVTAILTAALALLVGGVLTVATLRRRTTTQPRTRRCD